MGLFELPYPTAYEEIRWILEESEPNIDYKGCQ